MIPLSASLYPGQCAVPSPQMCSIGLSPGLHCQQDSSVYVRCDDCMQHLVQVMSWCMTT